MLTAGDEAGEREKRLAEARKWASRTFTDSRLVEAAMHVVHSLEELARVTETRDELIRIEHLSCERGNRLARDLDTALADLKRVEAERDRAQGLGRNLAEMLTRAESERDSAIASRNTWAEKASQLREALESTSELLAESGCFDNGETAGREGCECTACAQVRDNQQVLAATEARVFSEGERPITPTNETPEQRWERMRAWASMHLPVAEPKP